MGGLGTDGTDGVALISPEPAIGQLYWATASGIKRNNFDFLRLLLAVLVIYAHSYELSLGVGGSDGFSRLTRGQISGGVFAVDCFFAISGFLIAFSWSTAPGLKRYLSRRSKRILPGYLVTMAVCALVVAPLATQPSRLVFSASHAIHILGRVLLLQQYPGLQTTFAHNPQPYIVNGSMWTIQFEFYCYLLLALAGILGILRRRIACLIVFVSIMIFYACQQVGVLNVIHVSIIHRLVHEFGLLFGGYLAEWPRLLSYFWAGACLYVWRTKVPRSWIIALAACIALVIADRLGRLDLAMPLAGTYLLFWIAYEPALRLQNFGKFGDFSYGTYLYAYPIQQLVVWMLPGVGSLALFSICTPLAIFAGAASWHGVEKRFGVGRRRDIREGRIGGRGGESEDRSHRRRL